MDLVLSQIPEKASIEKSVFSTYIEQFDDEDKKSKASVFVEIEAARKKVNEVKAFDTMLFDKDD